MFEKYDIIVVGGGYAGCKAKIDYANLKNIIREIINLNVI